MGLNLLNNPVALTIIVPAYNGARYCKSFYLKSLAVLKKLGKNYELIFVDDSSTDNTLEILLGIQKEGKLLKVIKLYPNQG